MLKYHKYFLSEYAFDSISITFIIMLISAEYLIFEKDINFIK